MITAFRGRRTRARPLAPVAFVLLILASFGPLAGQSTWSLGRWDLALDATPSPPLRVTMARGSLARMSFVGRVGGVSFRQLATPEDPTLTGPVALHYDPSRRDGSRVTLSVGGLRGTLEASDWLVVPTARFADSEFDAVVSLFGENGTDSHFEAIYHDALGNTLLGLRLLQADLLLIDLDNAIHLPARDGVVVLGHGEVRPNPSDARWAGEVLAPVLQQDRYQSWVLTDDDVDMRFEIAGGSVRMRGEPYYHFWRRPELSLDPETARWMLVRYEAMIERYNGHALDRTPQLRDSIQALEDELTSLVEEAEAAEAVPTVTLGVRARWDTLMRLNPTVMEAARDMARFSALFRYVREADPGAWAAFLDSLPAAVEPPVVTPNRVPRG